MQPPARPPLRGRSPLIAAALSFLVPGAGQWYVGSRRNAVIYAGPIVILGIALLIRASGGLQRLALDLFAPEFAMTIIFLAVLIGLWRIAALVDATRVAGRGRRMVSRERGAVIALVALIVATHATLAVYAYSFYSAGTQIFVGQVGPTQAPVADASPNGSSPGASAGGASPVPGASDEGGLESAAPGDTPDPTGSANASQRINVLFLGTDNGPGRAHALTDTILLISVDPVGKTAAMVSIPRDLSYFRLPDGRTYTGKINSLPSYVRRHPASFSKGDFETLAGAVGSILGIQVPYYAAVDLQGFPRMIDAVGGVDIVNEQEINDPGYGGWTDHRPIGFHLSAGPHHLDGQTALAYARSRKGAGDNDFTRARRQQQLLVALRDKLTDPAMLPSLPALLDAAGKTLRTNYPATNLDELLTIAQSIPAKSITKTVLGPPYAENPPASQSGGIYQLRLVADKVAALSIRLFGADSRYNK